ncbi:MAG: pilus assembly protein [Bryobacterales bacterium]|nr:pilus assembly protein [Bryobacterales bacterium]
MNRRRGSVLIEMALSATLVAAILVGIVQLGYVQSSIDKLQVALRAGALYGSRIPYQARSGPCLDRLRDGVRRMVVYGAPEGEAGSVIPGLAPEHVVVDYVADEKGVPREIRVAVRDFGLEVGLAHAPLSAAVTLPYRGRYAPTECRP